MHILGIYEHILTKHEVSMPSPVARRPVQRRRQRRRTEHDCKPNEPKNQTFSQPTRSPRRNETQIHVT